MTDTSANFEALAKIGPGRLVLVVGPSGAGKDTLIDLARAACAGNADVVFARRVVTREASSSEDNEQLTPDAFRQALARGGFAVHWDAHGLSYALPKAIDDDIRAGRTVVANISRAVIGWLREGYADVVVVAVTAPPEVLAARLLARGRSSDGPIANRLQRAAAVIVPDVIIENVGAPAVAARLLFDQLVR
ncbi:phosphonate metabolism protein/1,5-bisphosphokinase (PRPP-forming) PhnN [Tardiphaga sp.]|uniref:phosphonate metabolism protein/1,5-bisphosphokinase (PRPP-forming) PhnN n=1 Tax=Tardiphaga sp. TaxID=1926292 RepID=UPI002623EDEA|nr:phosphonate metabolism protein/1,5-bisphosphokinase (PRPP-forming) PhnN [Tardiphaga sp.]MDB5618529.1 phosphonate metabolism protein/1,5-bisphosphokinase (PRPP-forming) PhnN [Tardiphaga sp.]